MRRWCSAVVRKSIFLTCVVVAVVLGESAVGIYFWRGARRGVAVAVVLGVCAVGIYLLWSVIRKTSFRTWAVAFVVALLAACAAGINLLWSVIRKPSPRNWGVAVVVVLLGAGAAGIYFWRGAPRWAVVVALLGVCAVGIYLLRDVIRKPSFRTWAVAIVVVLLGACAAGIYFWRGAPRWAAVAVLLSACAAGIYLLWSVIRRPEFLPWAAVVVALGVCAVGVYLLWGVWDGAPVAAAFTRVGGATRVETSLEASRFWLTPPQCVVETQAADAATMFAAARYAVKYDAPLLFTSGNAERNKLVSAKVAAWKSVSGDNKSPVIITFTTPNDRSHSCRTRPDPANINGVSTLKVPNQPLRLRHVTARDTLAPVVVFAAAVEPGNPSDVAVGLALAAHMAEANHEKVSLVVIPHYLESDRELENTLESQHELVTGGVVLGETPTVPEDTRVLLRQLLTSTCCRSFRVSVAASSLVSVGDMRRPRAA